MDPVTSGDGTTIGYDRVGQGPAVVLVSGASVDRRSLSPLAGELSKHFTVYNLDRRGRGDSEDTPPYAVEREVEDIDAIIAAAGGSAYVFGSSSGAVLALVAARELPISKVAMWEPPLAPEGAPAPPAAEQVKEYEGMIASGRRGDAVEYFMTKVVGMPAEFVEGARSQPWWAATEALAHTLAYDATIMRDHSDLDELASSVTVPTLAVAGTGIPWMRQTAEALAQALPKGEVRVLEGQTHDVDPAVLAPVLVEFLSA